MSASMISALQGLVTPGLIKTVSATLGESESAVTSGLESIVSKILAALTGGAGNPALMTMVANLVSSHAKDPGALGDIAGILNGTTLSSVSSQGGNQLIGALFGIKEGTVAQVASTAAGLKPRSGAALMSLAGPLVLGALAKAPGAASMTASALPALLTGSWSAAAGAAATSVMQTATAAPSATTATVAATKGAPVAEAVAASAKAATATVATAATGAATVAHDVKRTAATATADVAEHKGVWWLWPATLALIAGLAFAVWNMQQKHAAVEAPAKVEKKAEVKVEKKAEAPAAAPAPAPTPAPAPAAAPEPAPAPVAPAAAPAAVDGMTTLALPSGPEISFAANGVEGKLVDFLSDPAKAVDKNIWFDFDRLHFETGSTNLTGESKAQLKNVVEIMKAFPAAAIKIGGYTDNVGDPANNKKLSDDRAKVVQAALVGFGVEAARVEAEGYGEEHPIADNATAEGKAKNRRTALSVRAK